MFVVAFLLLLWYGIELLLRYLSDFIRTVGINDYRQNPIINTDFCKNLLIPNFFVKHILDFNFILNNILDFAVGFKKSLFYLYSPFPLRFLQYNMKHKNRQNHIRKIYKIACFERSRLWTLGFEIRYIKTDCSYKIRNWKEWWER